MCFSREKMRRKSTFFLAKKSEKMCFLGPRQGPRRAFCFGPAGQNKTLLFDKEEQKLFEPVIFSSKKSQAQKVKCYSKKKEE